MLADFLGSGVTRLMKSLDGVVGSINCILLYRGDFSQASCALFLSFLWKGCLAADLLCGSVLVSSFGGLEICELLWVVALLVTWSAVLFPSIPLWAGTHLSWMDMWGCL